MSKNKSVSQKDLQTIRKNNILKLHSKLDTTIKQCIEDITNDKYVIDTVISNAFYLRKDFNKLVKKSDAHLLPIFNFIISKILSDFDDDMEQLSEIENA